MYTTPIIINNFNRLSTTRKLYKDLTRLGYSDIRILDNNSTYFPLLDWYKSLENKENIKVEYFNENFGHKALWKSNYIDRLRDVPYIVYTDSDLELNPRTPNNFIEILINLQKEYKFDKVGLSIQISDLPDNFIGKIIRSTEAIYWVKKLSHRKYELYQGMIDTTFALFNPKLPFNYQALRVAGDFTCRHLPWYTDFSKLTKEEEYFIKTCDPTISTYAGHYYNYLEQCKKNQ